MIDIDGTTARVGRTARKSIVYKAGMSSGTRASEWERWLTRDKGEERWEKEREREQARALYAAGAARIGDRAPGFGLMK